jgi:diguanylate cyclase (GGDEF)-like protein/PAS domain S-box-containing protein
VPQDERAQAPASNPPDWAADLVTTAADVLYALRVEPERSLEYISPAAESATGHAPSEHHDDPNPLFELIDPRDAETLRLAHSGDFGEVTNCTVRWLSTDGRESWSDHRCRRVRRGDGSVVVYGSARDVTGHRANSAELAASAEWFRLLAENSSDIVYRIHPDGLLEWVSPSIEVVLGWDPADLVGTRPWDLVHPDDRAVAAEATARAAAAGQDTPTLDFRIRHRDGSHRWVSAHGRPITSDDQVVGYVVSLRDVDDQVRARTALARSEEEFRLLAGNATDLVVRTGPDRLIRWVSPTVWRTLGWEPQDLVGSLLTDLIHPEDRRRTENDRSRVYSGEAIGMPEGGYVLRMRALSGDYRWMSGRFTPVVDHDGQPDGAISGLRDVDELVRARQDAESDRQRLRATLDSLLDPHVLIRASRDESGHITDFTFVEVNSAACDYLMVPYQQLVGAGLIATFPDIVRTGLFDHLRESIDAEARLALDDFALPDREARHPVHWFDLRGELFEDGLSLTWRDVTDRHLTIESLAASEEHYRLLAENASDVVVRVRAGTIVWASPSISTAIGWSSRDWVGHSVREYVHPDDLARLTADHAALDVDHPRVSRFRVLAREGSYHWVEAHTRPYIDASGATAGLVAAARVVDHEVAADAELERRATRDELTGVLNRSEVLRELGREYGVRRRAGEQYAVLYLDLDALKAVNDNHGHAVGDELLRTYAQRIQQSTRAGDLVARMGGDEFLAVFDGVYDLAEATALAQKILLAVSAPVAVHDGSVTSTASVGVTLAALGESVERVVARSDRAMYEAKRSGGNRVVAAAATEPRWR